MKKGLFCISIDTELLWGRKETNYKKFINKTKKERIIIKKLLYLFKRYKIPATWAIVGKLYEQGNSLWSGKDIISWIKKEKIHELASHSYSHEDFSNISAKQAIKEFSFPKAYSFVFPKNKINYLSYLKKAGFKAYREIDETNSKDHFIQLINLILTLPPKTGVASNKNGLIKIPSSMYFVSNRGLRKYIPQNLRFIRAKKGIDKAIKNKEIFHLWFHPVDFADGTKNLFREFENVLKYANLKRKEDLLEIKTMKDSAKTHERSLE